MQNLAGRLPRARLWLGQLGDGTVLLGGAARVTINLLLNGLLSHILRSKLDSFTSADRVICSRLNGGELN